MYIYYDNSSAINILEHHVSHSRSKYIEIHHHFIRNIVEDKVVFLESLSYLKIN